MVEIIILPTREGMNLIVIDVSRGDRTVRKLWAPKSESYTKEEWDLCIARRVREAEKDLDWTP